MGVGMVVLRGLDHLGQQVEVWDGFVLGVPASFTAAATGCTTAAAVCTGGNLRRTPQNVR